jgi:hypothetical protein
VEIVISEQDRRYLINFIEEVLVTIKNDDTLVTADLEDLALNSGTILGLSLEHMRSLE